MRFALPSLCTAACVLLNVTAPIAGRAQDAPSAPGAGPGMEASAATPPAAPSATPAATPSPAVENSVVKVFSTMRYPDLYKPWTKQAPTEVTGSGVVIDGKRILTNAHVVLYASQVQVQANQSGDKISATVEAVARGIDLAVLKLDDDAFFDTHPPLQMAKELPQIKDTVLAYGYPQGGTSLSITKGIVSRIEFAPYNGYTSGLRVQIDAAINPGNSGGPALVDDRIIGLVFSHLGKAENIGYIIPTEEISLFLQDVADGHYDGKPAIFDDFQTLENPSLRAYLKLDKSVQGMIVHRPFSDAPDYPLKEWDVMTKIGDTPVDDQGMVRLGMGPRVRFTYVVQKIAHEGKVPMTVVRGGKEMTVEVPTHTDFPLVMPSLDGGYPSYFVYGPMVFSGGTGEFAGYLRGESSGAGGMLASLRSPLLTRFNGKPDFEGEQLVVVASPFFPHKLSKGYGSPFAQVIRSINGIRIKNLPHLVETLRDATDEFMVVEFDTGRGGETVVFPRKEVMDSTDEILTDNGVRSQGSPDTLKVWNSTDKTKTPAPPSPAESK